MPTSVVPPPQIAEVDGIESPHTRPPYLFVKCWSLQHRNGLVLTTYDARDVGFVIDKVLSPTLRLEMMPGDSSAPAAALWAISHLGGDAWQ